MNTGEHDIQGENPAHRENPCSNVLIAIGSNLGDPAANVERAFEQLQTLCQSPIQKSSLWKSTPVDCPPDSPDFINAAAAIVPIENETPESLLTKLQSMEAAAGRGTKAVLNEPRVLDLDLIAFGNEARASEFLTLPHRRCHLRRFVLEPLNEIAGDAVLPGLTKTISQILADLETDEMVSRL